MHLNASNPKQTYILYTFTPFINAFSKEPFLHLAHIVDHAIIKDMYHAILSLEFIIDNWFLEGML